MNPLKDTTNGEFSSQLVRGFGMYQRFNRYPASRVERIAHNRIIPPVVVELGDLVGLIYRSDKDNPGQPRNYIHFMETLPRLVSDVEGRRLFIVGGNYTVTEQGIEG